jgi:hypothetical protein
MNLNALNQIIGRLDSITEMDLDSLNSLKWIGSDKVMNSGHKKLHTPDAV